MFKNLFRKRNKSVILVAPMTGRVVKIEDVPDQVFSQKIIGDGLAIDPTEGMVVAPLDGEVVNLFPTKHAVGIRGKNGLEVLIHIGLETVALYGEGFKSFVKQGEHVKAGQRLITFDLDFIKENADSAISSVVITNPDVVDAVTKSEEGTVTRGESVFLTVNTK